MKQICDTEELRKAFEKAGLLQYIGSIQGEDIKQQDGSWLHACEFELISSDVPEEKKQAILQVWVKQANRDWVSWRAATDKIKELELKSGTTRQDRERTMRIFKVGEFQYNSAKMVEDQIVTLRPQLALVKA